MTHVRNTVRRPIRRRGSAIGILVVVGIVAGLAVVGVTQVRRAIIATNEAMALSSIKQIGKACQYYFLHHGRFPTSLERLGPDGSVPEYLPADLAKSPLAKQGYVFTYFRGKGGRYFTLLANPKEHGVTGTRHFYLGKDFAIHATDSNEDAYVHHPVAETLL